MASTRYPQSIQTLLDRGVSIHLPETVHVDANVEPDRIAPGVVIHPGCRITGTQTSIGPGSEIGAESPATVEHCQLGSRVSLKGGYFSGATFLDDVIMGAGSHVRPGTLLEEESSCARNVGLKQTILFPFVTAGSLIDFCDCFMAGGTSRQDHSEIGSSYIHFNFTPHHDKATPSLIGDVPRGVMLDQPPIFLGGQGGLVGPARIGFGCVVPAGIVFRGDAPGDGMVLYPPVSSPKESRPYRLGVYGEIDRVVTNNLMYIGNLRALQTWYRTVRRRFMVGEYHLSCYEGALNQLEQAVAERIKRLHDLVDKMPYSMAAHRSDSGESARRAVVQQERLVKQWPGLEAALTQPVHANAGERHRDEFLSDLDRVAKGRDYFKAIRALSLPAKKAATGWLQAIVDTVSATWQISSARKD